MKKEKTTFETTTDKEKKSNMVNIDIYRMQTSGSAQKIDKIYSPVDEFSIEALNKIIQVKHGPGAYRLRRYNTLKGYTFKQVLIEDAQAETTFFGNQTNAHHQAEIDALKKQLNDLTKRGDITAAKIAKINAETQIYLQKEALEIELKKRQLAKMDERTPVEKILEQILENKDVILKYILSGGKNGTTTKQSINTVTLARNKIPNRG